MPPLPRSIEIPAPFLAPCKDGVYDAFAAKLAARPHAKVQAENECACSGPTMLSPQQQPLANNV